MVKREREHQQPESGKNNCGNTLDVFVMLCPFGSSVLRALSAPALLSHPALTFPVFYPVGPTRVSVFSGLTLAAVDGTWHLPRPIQSNGNEKNDTSLNGPMLSIHSNSDDGSDVSFCVLVFVFAARQFQHDGKALVQFWGFRVDGLGTMSMR